MFDNVPNDSTGYVFIAYIVFLALLLIYLGILGAKFQRINREVADLTAEVEAGRDAGTEGTAPADPGARETSGA